jgi:hypothetical protein
MEAQFNVIAHVFASANKQICQLEELNCSLVYIRHLFNPKHDIKPK